MTLRRSLLVLSIGLLAGAPALALNPEKSSVAARADAWIQPFARAGHFSGVALVVDEGKVVYEKAFGLANADFNIPNRPDTRIGIASITKNMTLVILVRLVDEGTISLDDKVGKYLPGFPNGDSIDITMLARHRSGIPHRVMPEEMEAVPHSSAGMVEKIAEAGLAFPPGTDRLYSSAGYSLLARILEIASGKSYAKLLEEYVFEPAGMVHSVDFNGETIIPNMAKDYFYSPEGLKNAALKDYSFLVGAGSVFSTARDLYRFASTLVGGGYGELVSEELVGEDDFEASGRTNGHRAYLEMSKDGQSGFVLLSNLSTGGFDEIAKGLTAITKGQPVDSPVVPHPVVVKDPNESPAEYLGNYRREGAASGGFEVTFTDGRYFAGDIELFPTERDCFFEYRYYGKVCFVRDDDGKVDHIQWTSPGVDSKWVRY